MAAKVVGTFKRGDIAYVIEAGSKTFYAENWSKGLPEAVSETATIYSFDAYRALIRESSSSLGDSVQKT